MAEISLLGVGDVLIDRPDPRTIFGHVAEVLRAADITFANCEQMYSDRLDHPVSRHPSPSDPGTIDALEFAGFDVLSLANNHTMDWGGGALSDTLSRLRAKGFKPVGAGANLREARKPVVVTAKGVKVGFLAYGNTGPEEYAAGAERPGYAPVHAWTKYEKPDNWGIHFLPRVIPDYCREIGHAAVDAGADLVLGTHPHILKGIETYRGKAIFYSTSIIVKASISGEGIERVGYVPVHINRDAEPEIVGQLDPRGQEVFDYLRSVTDSEDLTCVFRWYGDEVVIDTSVSA